MLALRLSLSPSLAASELHVCVCLSLALSLLCLFHAESTTDAQAMDDLDLSQSAEGRSVTLVNARFSDGREEKTAGRADQRVQWTPRCPQITRGHCGNARERRNPLKHAFCNVRER